MTQTSKVQIKGLIRFSYLSENGFAKSGQGVEKTRQMLYDAERLERRFAWFERLAFHTLALQDDTDFTAAILIGDSFPDKARRRLEDIVAGFAPVKIVSLPPMTHVQAVKRAYFALPDDPDATHIATFRLDDDDGMHRATTARIRTMADALLAARPVDAPFVIGFNRGFYLNTKADPMLSERFERTPIGIGLALVARKGDHATVFRRNHRQFTQYYDCYTEVSEPMFIRSVHQDNDSGAEPSGREGTLRPRGIENVLRDGFGLVPEMLEGL